MGMILQIAPPLVDKQKGPFIEMAKVGRDKT